MGLANEIAEDIFEMMDRLDREFDERKHRDFQRTNRQGEPFAATCLSCGKKI